MISYANGKGIESRPGRVGEGPLAPRDGERNEASTSGVFPPPPLPKPSWMGMRRTRRGNQTPRETARGGVRGDAGFPGPGRAGGTGRTGAGERGWLPGSLRLPNHPGKGAGTWEPRHTPPSAAGTTRTSPGRAGTHRHSGSQGDPTAADPGSGSIFIIVIFFFFSTPTPEKCQGSNPYRQPFSPALCQGQSPSPCPAMCQTPAEPPVPTSPPPRPIVPPAIPGQNLSDTTRRREATAHPPIPQKSKSGSSFGGMQSPKNEPQAGDVSPSPPLHCRDPPTAGADPLPVPLPAWARRARY